MRKSELFEAFDLFDVRDFGKVIIFHFLMYYFLVGNVLSSTLHLLLK